MPAAGTSEYRAVVKTYQKNARFGKRLHVVKSDLFSDLPPGAKEDPGAGDGDGDGDDDDDEGGSGEGSGGGKSGGGGGESGGRFFDNKTGLFQLSMQAETTYVFFFPTFFAGDTCANEDV